MNVTEEQKKLRLKKDGTPKEVPTGVVWPREVMAKIKVLAKGWDRTVSWTIRDLVEGALVCYFDDLERFANEQVIKEQDATKASGSISTEESSAQLVQRLLADEKARAATMKKQTVGGQS
jgi:hypothetical protein